MKRFPDKFYFRIKGLPTRIGVALLALAVTYVLIQQREWENRGHIQKRWLSVRANGHSGNYNDIRSTLKDEHVAGGGTLRDKVNCTKLSWDKINRGLYGISGICAKTNTSVKPQLRLDLNFVIIQLSLRRWTRTRRWNIYSRPRHTVPDLAFFSSRNLLSKRKEKKNPETLVVHEFTCKIDGNLGSIS